jgi:hypothetical protein
MYFFSQIGQLCVLWIGKCCINNVTQIRVLLDTPPTLS